MARTPVQKKTTKARASVTPSRNTRLTIRQTQEKKAKLAQERKEKNQQIKKLVDTVAAKGRTLTEQIELLEKERPIPETLVSCPICFAPYSETERAPLVGSCGHTVCTACVVTIRDCGCPICRAVKSFCHPSKNFLAYDLLNELSELEDEDGGEPPRAAAPFVPFGGLLRNV